MSKQDDSKNHLTDSAKVEGVKSDSVLPIQVKTSYMQTILARKKAALEFAKRAYDDAFKKCEIDLGKLCIECGLGEYDPALLKDEFLKLAASFPKSTSKEKQKERSL